MPADTLIFDLAEAVLIVVGDALDAKAAEPGSTSPAAPERRLVADGEIADDCPDQLAVQVTRIFMGVPPTADQQLREQSPWVSEMIVLLTRCAPEAPSQSNSGPTAEAITDSARVILTDVWIVVQGIRKAAENGALPGCMGVNFGDLIGVGPRGGAVGFQLTLRATI